MPTGFFVASAGNNRKSGNGLRATELGLVEASRKRAGEQAMGERIKNEPVEQLSTGDASQAWLSTLIDTMETVSRREVQASTCDPRLVSAVKRQLARPTAPNTPLRPKSLHHRSRYASASLSKPFMI
jgi:hypothetical protein